MSKELSYPSLGNKVWGIALLLLCIASFIDGMDVSTIAVSLPAIQNELGISPTTSQWAVSAYVLGFGGFLLLGGRVADTFGHKRVFILSLLTFTIASIAGAFVVDGQSLIAARLIKGISAAFTTPSAVALLVSFYENEEKRAKALGIFASTSAAGFVLGMLLGGAVTTISWRLTMAMGAPITAIVLIMSMFVFPQDKATKPNDMGFDWIGAITITLGLVAFVFGITNAVDHGWSNQITLFSLIASIVLIVIFVIAEKTQKNPMLPLSIFRRKKLTFALITVLIFQGSYIGFQFVASLYYQQVMKWNAFQTGLAFVLIGMFVMFLAPKFSSMAQKYGAKNLIVIGMALQSIAYVFWAISSNVMDATLLAALVQIPLGIGYAMVFPSVQIAALGDIEQENAGLASGLFFSAFQIGGGIILGLTASIFSKVLLDGGNPYLAGSLFSAALAILTIVIVFLGVRPANETSPDYVPASETPL